MLIDHLPSRHYSLAYAAQRCIGGYFETAFFVFLADSFAPLDAGPNLKALEALSQHMHDHPLKLPRSTMVGTSSCA